MTVADPTAPVTETCSGLFTKVRTSITHSVLSGVGAIRVTVAGPAGRNAKPSPPPDGAKLGQVSGTGSQTMTLNGPARGRTGWS